MYSQIFKQLMDKTPMSYMTDLRINKAKELLLTTDKPVSDIAANRRYRRLRCLPRLRSNKRD
ncbi:helix-turn-helix domain-containing protein [Cohnella sp. GCM10020058]|uniref:helix-turn-helix domain-containing protein n=1 Tax=Cohnella sp. GCM10020058 TaxID=3317330 RepID=UPI00363C323D